MAPIPDQTTRGRDAAPIWRQALGELDPAALRQVLLERVLASDGKAAQALARRLAPPPRGRTIRLDVPPDATPQQILDAALRDMAAGLIAPADALTVARIVELRERLDGPPLPDVLPSTGSRIRIRPLRRAAAR